jgi:hypothetical protein
MMRHLVLCDGPIKVELEANGKGAILRMENNDHVEFSLARRNLQAILDGETIQVSKSGVFCRLTRDEDQILVSFAWKRHHESVHCSVDAFETLVELLRAE